MIYKWGRGVTSQVSANEPTRSYVPSLSSMNRQPVFGGLIAERTASYRPEAGSTAVGFLLECTGSHC